MDNFNFYSPTEFVFGMNRENECGELVKKYGGTKVLIHYGGGSAVRSGLIDRVKASADGVGDSFLYVITVKGTTGARTELPADLASRLDAIRAVSPIPVAAGFGIATKAQAEEVCRHADGFIVGSALVKRLGEGKTPCLE